MKRHARGFTLVELMVVCGIVGLLAAIATPNIMVWRSRYKLKAAAHAIVSTLRKAKSTALLYRRDVPVDFDVEKQAFYVDDFHKTHKFPLPDCQGSPKLRIPDCYGKGIELGVPGSTSDPVTFADNRIMFTAMGFLANGLGGSVYVRDKNDTRVGGAGYRINITGTVGNIRMDRCGTEVSCP